MKAVKVKLAGRELHLAFTVEAMFQVQDQFGGPSELIEAMRGEGREGVAAACRAAAIMAEQGELGRRSLGYDPGPMVEADAIMATITPSEAITLRTAISSAISLGFGREVEPENDEIDLGLAELNAQKKNTVTRAHYIHMGTASGLSKVETLRSTPGEIGDLWELYLKAHGVKRKDEDV